MTESEGNERLLAHAAWLQGLARSVVAQHDLAHDVAQDTLMVALRRGTAGVFDVRAWLATILRRLAGRRAQTERRRVAGEAGKPPREPALSPAELVAKAALQREVVDAVLRLAEPYRSTVLQRWLDEQSPEAIAEAAGVPLETVRTRLRRGLQQLRDDLDRRHGSARGWALPLLGITGFEEAAALAATSSAAATVAVGAGAMAMSVAIKTGAAVAAVGVVWLAWSGWPSLAGGQPSPAAPGVAAAPAAAAIAGPPGATRPERTAAGPSATGDVSAASPDPALVWQATGRVVDEATNQPVADAEVRFTAGSTARFVPGSGETARSAADGSFAFAFERLSPGYLELEVRHSEHGSTHVPALEMIAKAEARGTRTAAIGDVLLARGAQLAGRVLAADGTTPVPGARIVYYRAAFGVPTRFFGEAVDVAVADAAGAFVVPQRIAPGYRRHWLAAVTDTGVGWRELQLSRRAAAQDRFDLVLRPMASLGLLVTDGAGSPVAGALAVALPACEPLSSRYDAARQQPHLHPLPPFLRRTSGADGRVTLSVPVGDEAMQFGERVPAGRTVVRVVAAAHRQWGQTIELAAGTDREIGVRLVGGTRAGVRGAVLTQDGAAIAGAEVRIGEQRATTDAVGQFRIDGVDVATGTVAVQALARGFVSGGKQVDCQDASTEVEVEVRLAPARSLRGIVVDQFDKPVANAMVAAANKPGVQVQSGADGRFELTGVPLTERQVVVASVHGADEFALVVVALPEPLPDELRVEVLRRLGGARVEVQVVDRVTGRSLEPLMASLVRLTGNGTLAIGRPLQVRDGACHDVDTPAGRYRLQVVTRDGRRGSRELDVAPGVALVQEQMALDAAGTVRCALDTALVTRLPERLTVTLSSADCGGLRVPGRTSESPAGDFAVVVAPASERELEVVGAQPDTEFSLCVVDDAVVGDVAVKVAAGGTAMVTLVLHDAGKLAFASREPAAFDLLLVHWQLPGGTFSSGQQLFGCRGRTELGSVAAPVGAIGWRVGYQVHGGEMRRREGRVTVAAGVPGRVVLD